LSPTRLCAQTDFFTSIKTSAFNPRFSRCLVLSVLGTCSYTWQRLFFFPAVVHVLWTILSCTNLPTLRLFFSRLLLILFPPPIDKPKCGRIGTSPRIILPWLFFLDCRPLVSPRVGFFFPSFYLAADHAPDVLRVHGRLFPLAWAYHLPLAWPHCDRRRFYFRVTFSARGGPHEGSPFDVAEGRDSDHRPAFASYSSFPRTLEMKKLGRIMDS